MNVIRDQRVVSVHVIPGETIKGVLRTSAYMVCVDAAKAAGDLKIPLDQLYLQTLGGLSLGTQNSGLHGDVTFRARQPLLSLFGAAKFAMMGKIIVHHALAQETESFEGFVRLGLPAGTRQDGVARRAEFFNLLSPEDQARWSRQKQSVRETSDANRRLKDTKRAFARALRNKRLQSDPSDAAVTTVEAEIASLKSRPDFQQTVQRPLPLRNAAPVGTIYEHSIELVDSSLLEIGLFISAFEIWDKQPRIGGGRTVGYGQITADYRIEVLSSSQLRRDQNWEPAGVLALGKKRPVITTSHAVLTDAMRVWREIESSIRLATDIFVE